MTENRLPSSLGVVLAGGRSTRMGQDKGELRLDGQSLLERAIAQLQAAGCDEVWISGRQQAGWHCVADPQPGQGPLSGIAACHAEALAGGASRLLFVPVDTPLLAADCLARLLDALATQRAVHYQDSPLPLALRVGADTAQAFVDLQGRRAVAALHDILEGGVLAVGEREHAALRNFNTPEQWQALLDERGERR